MSNNNLSEELFKPRYNYPETSTMVRRHGQASIAPESRWYRSLDKLTWIWRGIPPLEIEEVLARIAQSSQRRSCEVRLDTVIGFRSGNWTFEWSMQAAGWQQRAQQESDRALSGQHWLRAASLFNIAAYPFLAGDELADQAQTLASRAFEMAMQQLPEGFTRLRFSVEDGRQLAATLHTPAQATERCPLVLLCGNLDALQSDYYHFFQDYLAPRGLAMLTLDLPSVGFSAGWRLSQDTSVLHQQVLRQLTQVPKIDVRRVALLGDRFGANVAVRLGYLEAGRVKAVATLNPHVHQLFTSPSHQQALPDMVLDMFASRMGMASASNRALCAELNRYSLKVQGLLPRRTALPMLAACWPDDPCGAEQDARLIAAASDSGKLLLAGRQPRLANAESTLHQLADWLVTRLQ